LPRKSGALFISGAATNFQLTRLDKLTDIANRFRRLVVGALIELS
jgi:hypothetical protein